MSKTAWHLRNAHISAGRGRLRAPACSSKEDRTYKLGDPALGNANLWSNASWTGAKYSLNAVDNNSNPINDTTFPAGMNQAWRDAAGMVAVPEPTTALLLGLGIVGLTARRWF